jgi:hypothetical protein
MKKRIKNRNGGFTLVELILGVLTSLIIILTVGIVLADSHKGWHTMYDRTYGDITTGGYVAKSAFDMVIRKSSISAKMPVVGSTGEYIEVYYYASSSSTTPDRYARFYKKGDSLYVDYGPLDKSGLSLNAKNTVELAKAVKSVHFSGIGTYIQIVLTLGDDSRTLLGTCATNRHSE